MKQENGFPYRKGDWTAILRGNDIFHYCLNIAYWRDIEQL